MPNKIFVDTVFAIALVNHRDQYHQQALELAAQFEGHPLLMTDAILLEIGNALARGYKTEATAIIEEFLDSEEITIVHLSPKLFKQAFTLYKTHLDKEWGLIDCLSFVVMRETGINQALTSDHHFTQAGFQTLMNKV